MKLRWEAFVCIAAFSFGTVAFAYGASDAEKLTGTWNVEGGNTNADTTSWVFEDKGNSLKITRMQGDEKLAEFECNTAGKDCEFKEGGKKAKVSMWFLGPKLVQLETKGSEVIKRRFSVTDQGDVMQVELIPISPNGKPETVNFRHVQVAAHAH